MSKVDSLHYLRGLILALITGRGSQRFNSDLRDRSVCGMGNAIMQDKMFWANSYLKNFKACIHQNNVLMILTQNIFYFIKF